MADESVPQVLLGLGGRDGDGDEEQGDDRGKARSSFSKQLQFPTIRLEVVSLNSLSWLLSIMWGSVLFCFVWLIVLVVSFGSSTFRTDNVLDVNFANIFQYNVTSVDSFIFYSEGVLRTVAMVMVIFLFIAFPQRVYWYARATGNKIQPLQTILVALLMLMVVSPSYTPYSTVIYWLDISSSSDRDLDVNSTEEQVLTSLIWSFFIGFSNEGLVWNTVTIALSEAFTFLCIGALFHYLKREVEKKQLPIGGASRTSTRQASSLSASTSRHFVKPIKEEVDEEEDGDDDGDEDDAHTSAFKSKSKDVAIQVIDRCSAMVHKLETLFRQSALGWLRWVSLMYIILLSTLTLVFQFQPSTVPLVGIISLIRVCTLNPVPPAYYQNVSVIPIDEDELILSVVIDSPYSDEHNSPCGLHFELGVGRVISIVMITLVELYLMYLIKQQSYRARIVIQRASYSTVRKEVLSFIYFRYITYFCWSSIMLFGVVAASQVPIESLMVSTSTVQIVEDGSTWHFFVRTYVNPLNAVGVNAGTVGFGSVYLTVAVWLASLAYVMLPPDSQGMVGWFTGSTTMSLQNVKANNCLLTIVTKEANVRPFLSMMAQAEREHTEKITSHHDPGSGQRSLHSLASTRSLRRDRLLGLKMQASRSTSIPAYICDSDNPLLDQIDGNLFVLETEVLLWHFMHLSYTLAHTHYDQETKTNVPLTWEQKQKLVEDPRFKLVDHIHNAETDTHAMVFASDDRIVVTFRGSVSRKNWSTDMDSSEVLCEYVAKVDPLLNESATRAAAAAAMHEPKVHRGFVIAYESVRAELNKVVKSCFEENASRVLFLTGHSLGGGLCILATCDLTVQLRLLPQQVSMTSWGTPKPGNYSFMTRFTRLCPSARRFALANDVITHLPSDYMYHLFTHSGWYHCGTEILMSKDGNLLIRPSEIERFLFQDSIGSASDHRRLTYASTLMVWMARSQEFDGFQADWWLSVIERVSSGEVPKLKRLPVDVRERVIHSLQKPGAVYMLQDRRVRDMCVETGIGNSRSEQTGSTTHAENDQSEEEQMEELLLSMLVQFRTNQDDGFFENIAKLEDYKRSAKARRSGQVQNTQSTEASRDSEEEEELLTNGHGT